MRRENWIDSLVQENSNVETPHSWLWWSSLSCISAAAGNNYYVTSLDGKVIYRPNVYIMLLGESGLGKGYPVNLASRLVSEARVTRVIKGRSSIQAIVQELSRTRSVEGKSAISDSRGFIVNGELSTAIIQDPDSLAILTDLYDGHYNPEWTNLLKGDGAEKLKNPYITALFGSSPAHFYDSIPQANIEGGYIGRNLIIYEEKRSKDVDLLAESDLDRNSQTDDLFERVISPKYVPHLNVIASKKGRLIPSRDAANLFNTWRRKWRNAQTHDKTGFLNRVPDHVMKAAICLCLADWEYDGEIQLYHFEEAISRVTALVYSNKRTLEGRGPDPLASATKAVLDILLAMPEQKIVRKKLLWKGYGVFNSFTLDQIIDNLMEMGWVKRVKVGGGKETDYEYSLSGEPLDNYKKWEKNK